MMLYPLYTLAPCLIITLNSQWILGWIEQWRVVCSNISCLFVKGTYVLQDNNFQLLTQMSDGKQYTEEARKVCRYFTLLKFLIYIPVVWLKVEKMLKTNYKACRLRWLQSPCSRSTWKKNYFLKLKRIIISIFCLGQHHWHMYLNAFLSMLSSLI